MNALHTPTDHGFFSPLYAAMAAQEQQELAYERALADVTRRYRRADGRISWTVVVDKYGETLAEAVYQDLEGSDDLYAAFALGISWSCRNGDINIDAASAKAVLHSLTNNDFFGELLSDWLVQGEETASPWAAFAALFSARLDTRCDLEAIREAG